MSLNWDRAKGPGPRPGVCVCECVCVGGRLRGDKEIVSLIDAWRATKNAPLWNATISQCLVFLCVRWWIVKSIPGSWGEGERRRSARVLKEEFTVCLPLKRMNHILTALCTDNLPKIKGGPYTKKWAMNLILKHHTDIFHNNFFWPTVHKGQKSYSVCSWIWYLCPFSFTASPPTLSFKGGQGFTRGLVVPPPSHTIPTHWGRQGGGHATRQSPLQPRVKPSTRQGAKGPCLQGLIGSTGWRLQRKDRTGEEKEDERGGKRGEWQEGVRDAEIVEWVTGRYRET